MPRRYPDYPEAYFYWNHIASLGHIVMAIGMVLFFLNILWSLVRGPAARDNPWGEGATTLERTL
jgi:cytochrome c oxidase subunit I